MPSAYEIAKKYIGLQEHRDRDELIALFKKFNVRNPLKPKETFNPDDSMKDGLAWCAVFVTVCLLESGMDVPVRYAARDFLKVGTEVGKSEKDLTKAKEGDIIIFTRGNNSYQGHVGFFAGMQDGLVKVLGGNQSDAVCLAFYKPNRIIGIRRV